MNRTKKAVFYVFSWCLFMASGLMGLFAVFGLCGFIWGPEVLESGPPDRTQPYFWVVMVLLAPFMLFTFAAGVFLIVLPLAAWLRIPVLDKSDWRNIVRLYKFVKRTRCDPSEEEKQKQKRRKARTATPAISRLPRTRRSLRMLAAMAALAAMPSYWWCGAKHVCMAGHMQHPPYSTWHVGNDVLWCSLLAIAALAGILSDFRGRLTLVGLGAALAFSRLGLGSGGGVLFPLEILVASAIALVAVLNLVRPTTQEASPPDVVRASSWGRFGRNVHVVLSVMPMVALGVVFWGVAALAWFVPAMLYQRAVETDDAQTITRLASWGLSVDWRDPNWQTPLHHAAMSKKADVCRLLIVKGADVNARDHFHETPLHWAHSADVARVLVENGADVHAENEIQSTPLHQARSAEIAAVLIAGGANVNAKNRFCRTPLNTATGAELKELLILAGSEVANSDQSGWTPMHDAAKWKDPEIIELLLSRCAPVDPRNGAQATPLHYAASRGHADVVRLLLARGADPHALNAEGDSPRSLAEKRSYQEVVDLLEQADKAAEPN